MVKTSIFRRSPLSPTHWPTEAFVWWQSLLFAVLLGAAVYVLASVFAVVLYVSGLLTRHDLTTFSWPLFVVQLFGYAAALAVLLPILPRLARRSLASLGLRTPRAADLAWGLCGAILMFVVATSTGALEEWLFHVKPDELQVHWLRDAHGGLFAGLVFLACIAAPFFEELAFRGFVFNALLRYMPVWAAVVGSAILFGSAHLGPGNAGAIVPLAASGAVLALVYYWSGSLIASMITHATFNLCTVVAVIAFHQS